MMKVLRVLRFLSVFAAGCGGGGGSAADGSPTAGCCNSPALQAREVWWYDLGYQDGVSGAPPSNVVYNDDGPWGNLDDGRAGQIYMLGYQAASHSMPPDPVPLCGPAPFCEE